MKDYFIVRYEIADGYVGGSRPQEFSVRKHEIEEDMDESDIHDLFLEMLQADFEQTASPEPSNKDEFMAWAAKVIANKERESDD